MKLRRITALAIAGSLALTNGILQAQESSALLNILVKKKILTDQEAEEVRADLVKEYTSSSAGKINLASSVTELKLGGDLRLRYQHDNKDAQVDPVGVGSDEDRSPSGTQRDRYRFRLRLNADFKLTDNWFGGVQLQTGPNSDSGNQTYENGFDNYNIFISRAFLGWKASDWLTVVGGKQPNPFYSTDLVWDPDINPTGLSESVRFHKMSFGHTESISYSKDGTESISTSKHSDYPWELTANLGQFIFDDNQESLFDSDANTDAFLFVGQLVGSYKFSSNVKLTIAPGLMFFNAADLSTLGNENSFASTVTNDPVSGETRKLVILTAPGDVSFKLGKLPAKFYWDAAYNTQGEGRSDDVYGLRTASLKVPGKTNSQHQTEDDFAWLVGFQLGENKKKGDWSFNLNYRQTGITSVDPNLNDSDFALGELNTRGFKTALFYNFTDFVTAGVTYLHAWNLRDTLVGGQATGGAGIADSNAIQVLQVDLGLKF